MESLDPKSAPARYDRQPKKARDPWVMKIRYSHMDINIKSKGSVLEFSRDGELG